MIGSEEIESYLSSIEEYIFDERKIVTYSWLSKTLGIHCNVSKQLLYTFFESNKKKDELCATYLIIGLPKDGEAYQVLVVKDKDLEEIESTLKSVTSKHIYSVQKCAELTDINVLYAAQKEDSADAISKGISAIDFNFNERDNTLIAKLKLNALPTVSKQPIGAAKKGFSQPLNKNKSPVKNAKNEQDKTCKTSEDVKEDEPKSGNNKIVVPSMFKNSTGLTKKPAVKASVIKNNTKGIVSFFNKTSKPINEPKKTNNFTENIKKEEDKKTESKVEERLSPLKENKATLNICKDNNKHSEVVVTPEEPVLKSKKPESKSKAKSKKVDAKRTKKTSAKKAEKDQKQRKRLVVISDSDSNSGSEDEEEVIREPTPEPEPTVVVDNDDDMVCGTPEPSSRKRKKKLVSQTFTSDEGYLVTEKQLVDASCSEDEETMPEKKFKDDASQKDNVKKESDTKTVTVVEKKTPPNSKATSPPKTKQASLMNFFKKK